MSSVFLTILDPVPQKAFSVNPGLKANPPLDSVSLRLTQTANNDVVNWVNDLRLSNVS